MKCDPTVEAVLRRYKKSFTVLDLSYEYEVNLAQYGRKRAQHMLREKLRDSLGEDPLTDWLFEILVAEPQDEYYHVVALFEES